MNKLNTRQAVIGTLVTILVLGIGILCFGLVLLLLEDGSDVNSSWATVIRNRLLLELLVIPLLLSGAWLVRRYLQLPANKALALDRRTPILYLRPFAEDLRKMSFGRPYTYEETLVSILDDAGPVIALGKPGERLPPLGAIRVYITDAGLGSDWRSQIRNRLAEARLVVIQAGTTKNLLWELDAAVALNKPERVVLSFLAWWSEFRDERERRYAEFRSMAPPSLRSVLPARLGRMAFLMFTPDWTAEPIELRKRRWAVLGQAPLSAEGLRQVLRFPLTKRDIRIGRGRIIAAGVFYPVLSIVMVWAAASTAWYYLGGERERGIQRQREFDARVDSLWTLIRARDDSLSRTRSGATPPPVRSPGQ